MTSEQAIALAETKFWETMTPREIAMFQFYEPLLCMPLGVFYNAMQETLGRPIWTHEYSSLGRESLERELLGDDTARPSMEDIINMIPAEKRVVISV